VKTISLVLPKSTELLQYIKNYCKAMAYIYTTFSRKFTKSESENVKKKFKENHNFTYTAGV
jgi:hypothetical protein